MPLLFVAWVNLDGWFILGLTVVVVCTLGHLLGVWLGSRAGSDAKTALVAMLASIGACIVNPYHIHAFTPTPELAYLLGDWLPAPWGDGGQALRGLLRDDAGVTAATGFGTAFPLVWNNLTVPHTAYVTLLLLSTLSCVLIAANAGRPDGPGLPLGRLLAWALIAILSLMQLRLLPFFAIVAAPVTALNFADFGRWWRRRPGWDPADAFNPGLARFAALMLVLIALGLAWPGWLHGRFGEPSARHVAWRIEEDPSLRTLAESLKEGQAKRVFNYTFDIANYCAWFAPGVRCYTDSRYVLFPQEAAHYTKAKNALKMDAGDAVGRHLKKTGSWHGVFRTHDVDHLAVTKMFEDQQTEIITAMCWLQPGHWTQHYTDGRSAAFTWSAAGTAPLVDLGVLWRREAFGPVPDDKRPPADGALPPQGEIPLKETYLEAPPAFPARESKEPALRMFYFEVTREHWRPSYRAAWLATCGLGPAGSSSAAAATVTGPWTLTHIALELSARAQPRDLGPPAAPLLAIRQARRAVHDFPYDAHGHLQLAVAYKTQVEQVEGFWIARSGMQQQSNRRTLLRDVQLATTLRNYLDVRPEDWPRRREFADFLLEHHHLDAGLEQYQLILATLEKVRPRAREGRSSTRSGPRKSNTPRSPRTSSAN